MNKFDAGPEPAPRRKPTVAQIIVGWLWSLAGILALILLIAAIWTAVD